MSISNPEITPLADVPADWFLHIRITDSYMAGKWSGYGYASVVAADSMDAPRQTRHTATQRIVHHSAKVHMRAARGEGTDAVQRAMGFRDEALYTRPDLTGVERA